MIKLFSELELQWLILLENKDSFLTQKMMKNYALFAIKSQKMLFSDHANIMQHALAVLRSLRISVLFVEVNLLLLNNFIKVEKFKIFYLIK